ncbi:MAG: hypothetical protein QOC93_4211 [Actinomycetota bacterium]|jgi:uncharacterized protein (DUF488 family)|nr:hypothetical protein [Cryptosporangiaceae bacterium]MDQ1679067.1 hypothetical protein [Actinomycetota bacterium]
MLSTVGYEGISAEELVSALREARVEVLADVRLNPQSRKRGLSRRGLAAALAEAGIRYVHLPALGNPKDNRDAFRRGEPAAWDRYRAQFETPPADDALDELVELARASRVALLCYEHDHASCHRSAVAAELLRRDPSLGPVTEL